METERALIRAEQQKIIKESERLKLKGIFTAHSAAWNLLEINPAVRSRASRPFPVEPVRSLDAIHIASALEFLQIFSDVIVLSFDKRILDNIEPLGLKAI